MPGPAVSYGACPPDALHRCITAVTDAGDAVTFGLTSEGGAYYMGVLSEGLLEKFYLDSLQALQEALRHVESVAGGAID